MSASRVAEGEVLGIVGESGSGKSMLALSVMGLLPPALTLRAGRISVLGDELAGRPREAWRVHRGRDMAMIFQEPMTSLNPVMRIGTQIAEVLRWRGGLGRTAARQRALELLEQVEIPSPRRRLDAYPHELSGGMRQRVMIAIALAGEPEAADRRRTDHRARRHHAGADPRPAAQSAARGPA